MPTPRSFPDYDVSPDGQRFLMLKPTEQTGILHCEFDPIQEVRCAKIRLEPATVNGWIDRVIFSILGHCRKSHGFDAESQLSDYAWQLRWSTQHLVEAYSQGSEIPGSFLDVDSSAARPGRLDRDRSPRSSEREPPQERGIRDASSARAATLCTGQVRIKALEISVAGNGRGADQVVPFRQDFLLF